jgi:hypothetical protein
MVPTLFGIDIIFKICPMEDGENFQLTVTIKELPFGIPIHTNQRVQANDLSTPIYPLVDYRIQITTSRGLGKQRTTTPFPHAHVPRHPFLPLPRVIPIPTTAQQLPQPLPSTTSPQIPNPPH